MGHLAALVVGVARRGGLFAPQLPSSPRSMPTYASTTKMRSEATLQHLLVRSIWDRLLAQIGDGGHRAALASAGSQSSAGDTC